VGRILRPCWQALYLIRSQTVKFIILLISILISGYVYSDEDCMTSSQVELQVEKILKAADMAFELKYKFESRIEQLGMYGSVRNELDPVHNAKLIHTLDRLSNSTMGLLEASFKFVENYEVDFKRKMERTLSFHYEIREKYGSVEGDTDLISLSEAVGYNNASQDD